MILASTQDYLGLARDPRVLEAAHKALYRYGAGADGSRILTGNLHLHEELEARIAEFLGREAALIFSTGFGVNLGTIQALAGRGDTVFCDRANHASIIDGIRLSGAKLVTFRHNDMASFRQKMMSHQKTSAKLVVTDSVFSMTGDTADLCAIQEIATENHCATYVDEAHGLGVYGPNGEGWAAHLGVGKAFDLIVGTFSKSLGSMGGFVAGSRAIVEYLRHRARSHLFTVGLSPPATAAALKSLEIVRSEPGRRLKLWDNVRKMREGFAAMGYQVAQGGSQIIPIFIGSETHASRICQFLFEKGVFVAPALYPAVPFGKALIRTSFSSEHTADELDHVLDVFAQVRRHHGLRIETVVSRYDYEQVLPNN